MPVWLFRVVDGLEVGRATLFRRKVKSGSTIEKAVKQISGGKTRREPSGVQEDWYTGTKNRAYNRYCKYLDKQVYGISAPAWGLTIATKGGQRRLLLNKVIQNISALGGSLFLKGNVLGGAVNTLTGFNNLFKEAMTDDWYGMKDWRKAHKYYYENFLHVEASCKQICESYQQL